MASNNEYLLPLGIDGTKIGDAINNTPKQIASLNDEAKKATDSMRSGMTNAGKAANTVTSETAKATNEFKKQNKQIQDNNGQFADMLQVLSSIANQQGKAFAGDKLKQYADAIKATQGQLSSILSSTNFNPEAITKLEQELANAKNDTEQFLTVIKFLEENINSLNLQPEELDQYSKIIAQIKQSFADAGEGEEQFEQKTVSLKTQLRLLKEEIAGLDENDPRFPQLAQQAAELEDRIGDVNAQIKLMSSDTAKLDAAVQTVQGLVGAFAVLQGVIGLVGDENEELQKTLLKVNAAMSILQGLQQIQNLLDKNSALNQFLLVTFFKSRATATAATAIATEGLAGAEVEATVATEGLNAAMAANPAGILIASLGILIGVLVLLADSTNDAAEAQERLNLQLDYNKKFSDDTLNAMKQSGKERLAQMKAQGASEQQIRDEEKRQLQEQLDTRKEDLQKTIDAGEDAAGKLQELHKNNFEIEQHYTVTGTDGIVRDRVRRIKVDKDYIDNLEKTQQDGLNAQRDIDSLSSELRVKNYENIASTNKEINDNQKQANDKAKAANEKRLAAEAAYQKALAQLLTQNRDLQISLLQSDREQSKAEAVAKYQDDIAAIDQLLAEQKKAGNLSVEIQQAANDTKRNLQNKLRQDLLKIDVSFYAEQQKLLLDASNAINAVYKTGTELQVSQTEKQFDDLINALKDQEQKILNQQKLSPKDVTELQKNAQAQIALEKAKADAISKIKSDANLSELEAQKQLALETADQLKIAGATEEQLTEAKELIKLGIIKKYSQESLTEITSSLEKQGKLTKEQIEQLLDPTNMQDAAAAGKDIFSYLGLSDKLDADTKSKILGYIDQINDATDDAQGGTEKKKPKTLFEWLGIKEESVRLYSDGISKAGEVTSQFFQSMLDGIDNQVKAKDKQIDILNQQINEVGDELGRELDLQKAGYSSNVKAKQDELNKLKAQRDQEQKDKEELQKKQAALKKAQIIADTFAQASNLITAASEIFSAFASIPIVGVPLAIAAIGLMLGSFAVAKVNAYKAAGQVQTFRHGGGKDLKGQLLQGPSHENGGIGLYNDKTGQKIAEYEGNEYLFAINQRSKGEYLPLLEAINADDTENIRKHSAMIYGAERLPDITDTLNVARKVHAQEIEQHSNGLVKTDLSKLDHLETIAENTKPVESETIIETEEYRLIKTPGRTRKIFKH